MRGQVYRRSALNVAVIKLLTSLKLLVLLLPFPSPGPSVLVWCCLSSSCVKPSLPHAL